MVEHPGAASAFRPLGEVKIKTHSVYIIQCTPNNCARLIKDEGDFICGEDQRSLETRQWCKNQGNLFVLDGLNVVTSEGVLNVPTKPR